MKVSSHSRHLSTGIPPFIFRLPDCFLFPLRRSLDHLWPRSQSLQNKNYQKWRSLSRPGLTGGAKGAQIAFRGGYKLCFVQTERNGECNVRILQSGGGGSSIRLAYHALSPWSKGSDSFTCRQAVGLTSDFQNSRVGFPKALKPE